MPTKKSSAASKLPVAVNCASCHGKDSRAKTFKAKFNHARDLTPAKWQMAISDKHIFESILKGTSKMPAFQKKLSEADIAALTSYVRTLKK
jgi:mono/diheme cytochrome c family protein